MLAIIWAEHSRLPNGTSTTCGPNVLCAIPDMVQGSGRLTKASSNATLPSWGRRWVMTPQSGCMPRQSLDEYGAWQSCVSWCNP